MSIAQRAASVVGALSLAATAIALPAQAQAFATGCTVNGNGSSTGSAMCLGWSISKPNGIYVQVNCYNSRGYHMGYFYGPKVGLGKWSSRKCPSDIYGRQGYVNGATVLTW